MKPILILIFAAHLAQAASSVVELREWRIKDGDDPAWLMPNYDDSAWSLGQWPRTSGFGDGRARVTIFRTSIALPEAIARQPLALGAAPIGAPFELWAEGVRVGTWGQWSHVPNTPVARHLVFLLPASVTPGGVLHIAIRMNQPEVGEGFGGIGFLTGVASMAHPPSVGPAEFMSERERRHQLEGMVEHVPQALYSLLGLAVACVCLVMFVSREGGFEYLYIALYCICQSTFLLSYALVQSDTILARSPLCAAIVFFQQCNRIAIGFFLAQICPALRRILIPITVLLVSLPIGLSYGLATSRSTIFSVVFEILTGYVMPAACLLAAIWLWRAKDYGSLLIALTLTFSSMVRSGSFGLRQTVGHAFGFVVQSRDVTEVLFLLTTVTALYLRFRREQKRQALIDRDLSAARLVQESLLTSRSPAGFAIDAVYLPASDVGGDFYQTIPGDDGSLLIVTGDVSGKGLPASLLVATVVGALGNVPSRCPAAVLEHLNLSILGKTRGGFVTCCAVLLDGNGSALIANAGHLPPFAAGVPVAVESGLPLGVVADAKYVETEFRSGALTFLSDGVVEAANSKAELFGFERTAAISDRPAAEIAEAAREWGQTDDITVLKVRRATA